jgi:hypothetical protein
VAELDYLLETGVRHNYYIRASPAEVFEYLSDIKMLLLNIPAVEKIQYRPLRN